MYDEPYLIAPTLLKPIDYFDDNAPPTIKVRIKV
jgi:hypothetical protein